jgi:NTP pyrophosphatase (non-canonical NTP hydrolase)
VAKKYINFNKTTMKTQIEQWAKERNIHNFENRFMQVIKLSEEVGELSSAILKENQEEIEDAIGDIQVVLIILCKQIGLSYDICLEMAWNQIKNRKGKTINGTFIKQQKKTIKQDISKEKPKQETIEQTPVEWLVEKLNDQFLIGGFDNLLIVKEAIEMEKQKKINTSNINRVEVIQHSEPINGRVYVNNNAKDVEIQFQDDNKTLKIFLK